MKKYIYLVLLSLPTLALAQQAKIVNPAPGLGSSAWDVINVIIQISKWFVIPAITIIIIYSGFEMATASGDIKKIDTAKKRLLGAVIGAAVLFGAEAIVNIVRQTGENIVGPV